MQITAANAWVEKLVAGTVLAQKLFAKEITIPSGGVIQSQNFSEGTQGFRIMGNGDFILNNASLNNCNISGFIVANNTPFIPVAEVNIGYNDNTLKLVHGRNIKSVNRDSEGIYTITFANPVKTKAHLQEGNYYIDFFVVGNSHYSFSEGFNSLLTPAINWTRNAVNNRLPMSGNIVTITYATIYFSHIIQEASRVASGQTPSFPQGNTEYYIYTHKEVNKDPVSSQLFFFLSET